MLPAPPPPNDDSSECEAQSSGKANADADADANAGANGSPSSLSSSLHALALSHPLPSPSLPPPPSPRSLHLFLDLDGCLVLDSPLDWSSPPHPRPFLGLFLAAAFRLCASVSMWTAAGAEWLRRVHVMIESRGLLPSGAAFLLQWSGARCRLRADRAAIEAGDFYARRRPTKPLSKAWRRGAGRRAGMRRHNTLIVDDTPADSHGNYGNALHIAPFDSLQQEAEDDELRRLAAFLPVLARMPDVRAVEKRGWSQKYALQDNPE